MANLLLCLHFHCRLRLSSKPVNMANTGYMRRNQFSTLLLFSLFTIVVLAGETSSFFTHHKISTVGASSSTSNSTYIVTFDAESPSSCVHVFHFNQYLDLLFISSDIEVFSQIKPGLSSYADDHQKTTDSLIPLLKKAIVPQKLQSVTLIRLGPTRQGLGFWKVIDLRGFSKRLGFF